jgi:dihydrofolate synthase/folylpolyglutamate synthase
VVWEGRLETVGRNPVVLLDGAHNPAAADVLAQYLRAYRIRHPTTRIVLVFGMMRDKDHGGFLEPLRDVVSEIVLTQADISRAATVQELQFELGSCSVPLHKAPVPAEALSLARQLASTQDVICVTGSLMLVGEVKAAMRGCGLSPLRG